MPESCENMKLIQNSVVRFKITLSRAFAEMKEPEKFDMKQKKVN